ncbi:MAG: ATP-binding protein [Crocinitomicaceae bacterium]|nr:ATP-binding protein [Crocinitomicaceae bacterium]
MGTQAGLCYWDGIKTRTIPSGPSSVVNIGVKDSCIYSVQLNQLIEINSWTNKVRSYNFSYSDYRKSNLLKDGILTVSSNLLDTIFLDYQLRKVPHVNQRLSTQDKCKLGNYQIHIDKKSKLSYYTLKADTNVISSAYTSSISQYDDRTVFLTSNEGLIELSLDENNQIQKQIHLSSFRAECSLIDRNKNLWVGTAENGLYMFHRNMIQNKYYPQYLFDGAYNSCWAFAELKGELYNCTSNGLVAFERNTETPTELENLTDGLFCFAALESAGSVFLGTAREGLFRIEDGQMKRIYFNAENPLDNSVIQIIQDESSLLFCTKAAVHRLDSNGKIESVLHFPEDQNAYYIMSLHRQEDQFLAANTNGFSIYDTSFRTIQNYQPKNARVFTDMEVHDGQLWLTTMDGGIFMLNEDRLISIPSPEHQLLTTTEFKGSLWFTGISNALKYTKGEFISYSLQNGFPIAEYAQGGLFKQSDSVLYFSGVQGIFAYSEGNKDFPSQLPKWNIQLNGRFLPNLSKIPLRYDQSTVNFVPRAIITSDANLFELSYHTGKEWRLIENGTPLILDVEYGITQVKFQIRNKLTKDVRISSYQLHREKANWMKGWFKILLIFLVCILLVSLYFLRKYYRTKKQLKAEEQSRRVIQERLRISRELHDNIGARLSHIISSLDIQLFKAKESTEIGSINSFAKETMNQLRETIWAIGDKTIFLSELKQRIEHYCIQTNELSVIAITYVDRGSIDFELNATETINLFRIVQEAINNALKYSGAKTIEISVNEQEKTISFSISDNGRGFSVDQAKKQGSGLRGMIKRSEEINASLKIDSRTGNGTRINLRINKR